MLSRGREITQWRRVFRVLEPQALHRFALQRVHFLVLQSLRNRQRIGFQQCLHDLLTNICSDFQIGLVLHILAHIRLEPFQSTLGNLEHCSKVVIEFRQDLCLNAVCRNRKIGLFPCQLCDVIILRKLDLKGLLVAGLHTLQAFFEVG